MKLLITGASGFLGKKILARSILQGINIHVMGRSPVPENVGFSRVDVRERQAVFEVVRAVCPTHILHLASMGVTRDKSSLEELLLANTVGTDNLLNAASTLSTKPYVIMLGTAYEYESSEKPLGEDSTVNPKSPYAITKTASAFCMSNYAHVLPMLYMRLFNLYGPGEPDARLIPYIVECAHKGVTVDLTGCEQLRDFMFVDDFVEVVGKLLSSSSTKNVGTEILNVGTGIPIPLKQLILTVVEILKAQGIAADINFGALPYRKEDPMICIADNSRLLDRIGPFTFTSLSDGVERTVRALL
jgi:UDP-glucose 4-epimerase